MKSPVASNVLAQCEELYLRGCQARGPGQRSATPTSNSGGQGSWGVTDLVNNPNHKLADDTPGKLVNDTLSEFVNDTHGELATDTIVINTHVELINGTDDELTNGTDDELLSCH